MATLVGDSLTDVVSPSEPFCRRLLPRRQKRVLQDHVDTSACVGEPNRRRDGSATAAAILARIAAKSPSQRALSPRNRARFLPKSVPPSPLIFQSPLPLNPQIAQKVDRAAMPRKEEAAARERKSTALPRQAATAGRKGVPAGWGAAAHHRRCPSPLKLRRRSPLPQVTLVAVSLLPHRPTMAGSPPAVAQDSPLLRAQPWRLNIHGCIL